MLFIFIFAISSGSLNATATTPASKSKCEHKLTAVNNHETAEILYSKIRKRMPRVEAPPAMEPDFKNRICHYITGSNYFSDVLEEKRVYMSQMYEKLKDEEPEIFDCLYEPSDDTKSSSDLVYTNRTMLVDVYPTDQDRDTVSDYVFTCVTVEPEDDNYEEVIKVYFVSGEYNLSEGPDSYIPGRFVFAYSNKDQTETDVFAVAEIPAKNLFDLVAEVEDSYLENRKGNQPEENEIDDPICKLRRRERLRLCTLVLSSEYFESELQFTPDYEYIDRKTCTKKEISFEDANIRSKAEEKHFEEWMISCRPEQYYASYQAEYFLSRVYNSTTDVFVYRRGRDSRLFLENRFTDVRFIIS